MSDYQDIEFLEQASSKSGKGKSSQVRNPNRFLSGSWTVYDMAIYFCNKQSKLRKTPLQFSFAFLCNEVVLFGF